MSRMTSREIVTRVINYDRPPRFAYDFLQPHPKDILHIAGAALKHRAPQYGKFGDHPELSAAVPWFRGETRMDNYGNIIGRLGGKTKGECVKGALQDDFNAVAGYDMPLPDEAYYESLKAQNVRAQDKFVLAGMPIAIFSTLRDMRLMANALTDTLLDPENVARLMQKISAAQMYIVERAADCGADGMMIADDWGTQDRLFVGPKTFRELFKPVYKALGDALHAHGLKFFMHSCGYVHDIIDDLIEAGVDVFQFDQPELVGSARLAKKFNRRAALFSPVDIQKIMVTGDRKMIEDAALAMTQSFREMGGGLIMKDYSGWGDIGVKSEWADWARDALINNSAL